MCRWLWLPDIPDIPASPCIYESGPEPSITERFRATFVYMTFTTCHGSVSASHRRRKTAAYQSADQPNLTRIKPNASQFDIGGPSHRKTAACQSVGQPVRQPAYPPKPDTHQTTRITVRHWWTAAPEATIHQSGRACQASRLRPAADRRRRTDHPDRCRSRRG